MPWSLNPPTFELRAGFTLLYLSPSYILKIKLLTLQVPVQERTSTLISSLSTNALRRALPSSAWLVFGAWVFGKGLARAA